jgi:GNAT superfamily N-acetyltransferase
MSGEILPCAPESLSDAHDLTAFDCGTPELNKWLRTRAAIADGKTSRTYVITHDTRVVAYYCLSAGSILREDLPSSKLRRNTPEHVPVIIIGRLAVDRSCQGQGYGKGLLKDAILRSLAAAAGIGVRAILVHAIDDAAAAYYRSHGFLPTSLNARTLVLPIETATAALEP